jgi:hypothetical protein
VSHLPLRSRAGAGAAHAHAGALVGITQAPSDARGPPLAVGHRAVDANRINEGVTNGKAVVAPHKEGLWALGSKCDPPEAPRGGRQGNSQCGDG